MVALIILNTHLPPKSKYLYFLERADLILCADGGAHRALEAGIEPDYVIGDLDSVTMQTREQLPKSLPD